jgi:hypothetical protein
LAHSSGNPGQPNARSAKGLTITKWNVKGVKKIA